MSHLTALQFHGSFIASAAVAITLGLLTGALVAYFRRTGR